jgi:hypothetical protein
MSLRRKLLITAGIVLGVAILIPVIHHYQLRAATEAYIAQLKAQGEPMELSQVLGFRSSGMCLRILRGVALSGLTRHRRCV